MSSASGADLDGGGSLVLRIHDLGHKQQIVCNGIAVGQLAQACSAFGEQTAYLGQQDAGKAGVIQRFDFTGLKNALH
jgi:hypothetical protein